MRASSKNVGILPFAYVVIVVAFIYPLIVFAQQSFDSPVAPNTSAQEQQPVEDEKIQQSEKVIDLNSINKNLFKRLFIKRRKEHLEAVKNLQKINNYERQYKMINILAEKMFDVIESKKTLVENFTESELANITFSTITDSQNNIKDAISSILENIAFFGDVVLNLPDITQRILKVQPKWNATIRWSFNFLNKKKDWLDNSTLEMVDLVLQELNITKREPNYVNPKRIVKSKISNQAENKKKEKRKKGPMITKIEL